MAVIDDVDSKQCVNSQDYTKNTCRNIVTLTDILNGTGASDEAVSKVESAVADGTVYGDDARFESTALREHCLRNAIGEDTKGDVAIRTWLQTQWDEMAKDTNN